MAIEITAFRWVPPFAQGYVRDLWVRWALEEAGLGYETVLVDRSTQDSPLYRAWQPFGKVPAYRDDEVTLFESGAIVLHIASKSGLLAPPGQAGLSRVACWVLAALNTIDPHVSAYLGLGSVPDLQAQRANVEAALAERLKSLSGWLGEKDFLEDRFSAGDLMMVGVLRNLDESGLLVRFPNLDGLRQRCETRGAFRRALEDQMRVFEANAPD